MSMHKNLVSYSLGSLGHFKIKQRVIFSRRSIEGPDNQSIPLLTSTCWSGSRGEKLFRLPTWGLWDVGKQRQSSRRREYLVAVPEKWRVADSKIDTFSNAYLTLPEQSRPSLLWFGFSAVAPIPGSFYNAAKTKS